MGNENVYPEQLRARVACCGVVLVRAWRLAPDCNRLPPTHPLSSFFILWNLR